MPRNLLLLLLMAAQASGAMPRNPFQPLVTPCDALTGSLDKWQLKGVVSSAADAIAIMQDPSGRWRRITTGMDTEPGTPVTSISQQQLTAALPAKCGPSVYQWKIKGVNHDMDANVRAAGGMAAGKPWR
ncbi:HofP DNA utilization family protein [Dryocola sp. LX212]|jgi:hypothetical protein